MIDRLRTFRLVYISTPYSLYVDGIEAAFIDSCKVTARLISAGVKAYSPIAHTHPVAIHGGLDALDHGFWLSFNETMMDAADACAVAMMSGWHYSKGIDHEIAFFRARGKPVIFIDPMINVSSIEVLA